MIHGFDAHWSYLAVVVQVLSDNVVRPITCIPMSVREVAVYDAWRLMVLKRRSRTTRPNPSDGLPEWPINKPIPVFRSWSAENRFWRSWSFANLMEAHGEACRYVPRRRPATRRR